MSEVRRVVVQYRTTPEHAEENASLIEAVYAALAREQPEDFRYATFRLADETFVHVASIETADGVNPLDTLPEFAAFSQGVAARCDGPPVASPATLVGSYRLFNPKETLS